MFQSLDKRQKMGSYGIAVLVLFVLGVIGSSYMHRPQSFKVDQQGLGVQPDEFRTFPVTLKVSGEVKNPGEYTLASGMKVDDAIESAGGSTTVADLTVLDLSAPLTDGTPLVVPRIGSDDTVENYLNKSRKPGDLLPNSVSINDATAEELDELPYIGPVKAAAIIEYRERIGRFKSIEEVMGVKGIGDGIFAKIKPYIKL